MKLTLIVLSAGKAEGHKLPIPLAQFLIGRDPQCHLRPVSELISKRHCAIMQKGEQAFVRDFGSLNGTFVNNEKVEGQRELKHDDELKAGPLLFRVEITEVAPSVDEPTPPPATKKTEQSSTEQSSSASEPTDDEEMAALLLSSVDGDDPVLTPSTGDDDEVPDGTTRMDLPGLDDTDQQPAPEEKKEEPKLNTAEAAAAALQAYSRRKAGG
ncbi:MAG: FHA domain-containing protein [Gemmataceae bacterium]